MDAHLYDNQGSLAEIDHQVSADFADLFAMHAKIRDTGTHAQLQNYLVEHMWRLKEEVNRVYLNCMNFIFFQFTACQITYLCTKLFI
jgi:hypothetical protein